ncbi:hypothetical protein BTJ49_07400 [Oleiagrimonas sp. MCCC 1A03011]|nr:hypothetical protein BTJ49_07400 [Oleiagrimonas sp. MCCC 1A03011]
MALALFEQVKEHAGMLDWPCVLQPQQADPDIHVGPALLVQGAPQSPAGTYRRGEEGVVITYRSAGLSDPESLIATLAHELAHYRTADFPEPPPGGCELWEPATDLTAVFLGFGLFLTNSHFRFSQHMNQDSLGWRTTRHGYLSEPELLHAHAIFCALRGLPVAETLRHLKPALRGLCKRLFREVAACTERLDQLRAMVGTSVHSAGGQADLVRASALIGRS